MLTGGAVSSERSPVREGEGAVRARRLLQLQVLRLHECVVEGHQVRAKVGEDLQPRGHGQSRRAGEAERVRGGEMVRLPVEAVGAGSIHQPPTARIVSVRSLDLSISRTCRPRDG